MITVANTNDTSHRAYHLTHLRYYDSYGNVSPKGGVTVSYKVEHKDKPTGYPAVLVKYGIAICRHDDRYERAVGREAAMLRVDLYAKEGAKLFREATQDIVVDNTTDLEVLLDDIADAKLNPADGLHETAPGAANAALVMGYLEKLKDFQFRESLVKDVPYMEFIGAGAILLDLPSSLINVNMELAPSRFLHLAIVRQILDDARTQGVDEGDVPMDRFFDMCEALDPKQFSEFAA